MKRLSKGFVLDANTAIKTCFADPLTPKAKAILEFAKNTPASRVAVPDLFYVECANVFWKMTKFSGLPEATAKIHLNFILAL